ncbi:MAG: fibronectin type III domain-containing protein [Thermoanaerobaculia bacterium]
MESANLRDVTAGSKLIFTDSPQMRTTEGRPMRLTYAVVSEGENARSPLSNLATIVPHPVAVAPSGFTATAGAAGVVLSWKAPEQSIAGGTPPVIAGYNIYRGAGDSVAAAFDSPVNQALITETSWTDVPPYGEHTYRVTAVAAFGPPRLESEPSVPAKAAFKDLVAPPPPASVSALVETSAIRLVWDAVDAPDLAGYRIQRAEGTGLETLREVGKFPLTALTQETTYLDTSVQVGISFRYEVTTLDKSGNESAPVSTGWVIVTRTP